MEVTRIRIWPCSIYFSNLVAVLYGRTTNPRGLSAIKYYKCCVYLTCVELSIRLVFLATYSHFLYWQNSICGVMISDLERERAETGWLGMCRVEKLVVSVSYMYLDPTKHDGDIINRKVTDVYDNNKKLLLCNNDHWFLSLLYY